MSKSIASIRRIDNRIRRCEEVKSEDWKKIEFFISKVWEYRIKEDPRSRLNLPFLRRNDRKELKNFNRYQWKDFEKHIKSNKIRRKFELLREENRLDRAKKSVKLGRETLAIAGNIELQFPRNVVEVFEYWQKLPLTKRVRVLLTKPLKGQSKIFQYAIKEIQTKLERTSKEKIMEVMKKYSDLLSIMEKKSPPVYRQFGFSVDLRQFFKISQYNRDHISDNAPHKDVSSWYATCKKDTVTSLYFRYSHIGRFGIKPEHEKLFNLFLGYYWKWFVLPKKNKKIKKRAEDILDDLSKSILELFEDGTINLEDFDFFILTKVNSGFSNYLAYIETYHRELLKTDTDDAERGVRAVFKSLECVRKNSRLLTFQPRELTNDWTYDKFEKLLETEESSLAIKYQIREKQKDEQPIVTRTRNSVEFAREASRLNDELFTLQEKFLKGKITSEEAKSEYARITKLMENPLGDKQDIEDEKEKEKRIRREKLERKVKERMQEKKVDYERKLLKEKKKEAQILEERNRRKEKKLKELEEKQAEEDQKIIKNIPSLMEPDAVLDSKPDDGFEKYVGDLHEEDATSDLEVDPMILWEDQVYDTFRLRDPWNNDFSWTFFDTISGQEVKCEVVDGIRNVPFRKTGLGPPRGVRVWTCPNGLLFIDGAPLLRTGRDTVRLADFQNGIFQKPEYYAKIRPDSFKITNEEFTHLETNVLH